MRMFAALCPGSPEVCSPLTPGVLPISALEMFATGVATRSVPFTWEIEPVTFTFFWTA